MTSNMAACKMVCGYYIDCSVSLIKKCFNFFYGLLSCSGNVPIEVYKTDFKLVFILLAIYTYFFSGAIQTNS